MTPPVQDIKNWLITFTDCVRKHDFEAGRAMFYQDVICFGSKAEILVGLDDLIERQWKSIWPNITDFSFVLDELHCELNGDGTRACVLVPWTSTGYHQDGTAYSRPGRVTMLLIHDKEKKTWLAKHTHYSLYPGTPNQTFGLPSSPS